MSQVFATRPRDDPRRERATVMSPSAAWPHAPNNLPAELTSFVGRERQLAMVSDTLTRARLLTLTGVGGCGKTHLALRAAASLAPRFADGVYLVQLAGVQNEALVPRVVAAALGVNGRPDQPILETLVAALSGRTLLLLLDNCEHLIAACASVAYTLLRACPDLRILTTSREALRVPGEVIRRVPALELPPAESTALPESLAKVEAMALFLDRARARQPDLVLTQDTAHLVAHICRRLDGLPLAIELAAARAGVMSLPEIARDLDDSVQLLSGGSRTVPRQETLRATLDWSDVLLSHRERVLFRRLSVFALDFGARAAEQICSDDEIDSAAIVGLLTSLVEKSLVETRMYETETRYRLLEPVRQYAWGHLVAAGEAPALHRRHARYYAELAEAAARELMSPDRSDAIDRLVAVEHNIRAALHWSRSSQEPADIELGLRLASPLAWFWNFRGQASEGLDWFEALLGKDASPLAPAVRADALHAAGELAILLGQTELARARLDESAELYSSLGDKRGIAYVLQALAMIVDPPQALDAAAESLRLFQEVGDAWGAAHATFSTATARVACGRFDDSIEDMLVPWRALGDDWGTAQALNFLGDVARSQDHDARAAELYEEALAVLRKIGMTGTVPSILHNLSLLAVRAGDARRAVVLLREGLVLFRNQGDQRGIADCLEVLVGALGTMKEPRKAAQVLGAADVLRELTRTSTWPANAADVSRGIAAVRDQLDGATFSAARAAGRLLTLEQVLSMTHIAPEISSKQTPEWSNPLSPREMEIARLVVQGFSNRQIATELVISDRTAATHVAHILDKLDLRTRAQIAAWGAERGLLASSTTSSGVATAEPSVILRIARTRSGISQSDDVGAGTSNLR